MINHENERRQQLPGQISNGMIGGKVATLLHA
jgi:hypothetical protein